jgi:tetratricopeptide (TPR) repeat protein
MKLTFSLLIIVAAVFLTSCGGKKPDENKKPSLESLKTSLKNWEDSLSKKQENGEEIISLDRIELINRCLALYKNYPENDLAPAALDKVHMIFSGIGAYPESVAYADTVLEMYPKYVNRALVLESQGSSFDIFIQPRDSSKVRFYYTLLLKEYANLDKEKRDGIEERLKMNHLNFDDYLNTQIEKNLQSEVVK